MKTEAYTFKIKNDSNEKLKWVFGGTNLFLRSKNFGSAPKIKIESLNMLPYDAFLQDLSNETINVSYFRFMSFNEKNRNQKLGVFSNSINQKSHTLVELEKHLDPYQFQTDIIDVSQKFILDKRHHLEGFIEANSEIIISFFDESKENKDDFDVFRGLTNLQNVIVKDKDTNIRFEPKEGLLKRIKNMFKRKKN